MNKIKEYNTSYIAEDVALRRSTKGKVIEASNPEYFKTKTWRRRVIAARIFDDRTTIIFTIATDTEELGFVYYLI